MTRPMIRTITAVIVALTLAGTGNALAQSARPQPEDEAGQAMAVILQSILQILESSGKRGSATSDVRRIVNGGQSPSATDFDKVMNALEREAGDDQFLRQFIAQLRAQLATPSQPSRPAPATPPAASAAVTQQTPRGRERWACGVQTSCIGDARAELPVNGSAQLRLVDSQSNVLAYMNVYWTSLGPVNSIRQRELTVTVGLGSTSECKLTSDVAFYVNGRIETFLGGAGSGPEAPSMTYRKVTRSFYIPDGATVTVGPGMAYCSK
jgi:hypothetical protein